MGADVLADGDLHTRGRRRSGLRLAHGTERKHAEGGKAPAEKAGAAQQCAAIKPAAG